MIDPVSSRLLKSVSASIFARAVGLRAGLYNRGILRVKRVVGSRVVSVGNIRAGGMGKTPLTLYLANYFKKQGVPTGILLRGYGGTVSQNGGLVSSGDGPLMGGREAGDEAVLAAVRTRDVLVWAGADRESGAQILSDLGAEVIVVDDGFQRLGLHRDLNIAMVCPEDLLPHTPLLPKGPLRETGDALGRAHLIGGLVSDYTDSSEPPDFLVSVTPSGLVPLGFSDLLPLQDYLGKRVHLLSGIARPIRFEKTAVRAGFNIGSKSVFPDHYRFGELDLERVRKEAESARCEFILTTEKDLVRLNGREMGMKVLALRIEVGIETGGERLADALRSVST